MPYIKPERRAELQPMLEALMSERLNEGDMNYVISNLCLGNLEKLSYAEVNKTVGVLECVKLELYRRLAAPYEDKKAKENGDIY